MINVHAEVRRLMGLTVAQLRAEFELVSGEPTNSNNKTFLIKRIAWRLQAAEHGGLSDRARARAAELAREQDLRVRPRPDVHAAFAEMKPNAATRNTLPPVGTILTRVFKGRRVEVQVLAGGEFEYQGQTYGSLSAVAKAVTGSAWNGRLFFELSSRGGAA
ncbi:MAG: DUF2924 domain-containing protein [Phycisphaerales bacterium]